MKIVLLDGFTTNPGDLSWKELNEIGDVTIYDNTAGEDIIKRAEDAEIVLTNKVPMSAATISALPKLKYIGVLATGYNIIDVEAAKARGIVVTNIPAYSTASVAQIVFAHILNIVNRVQHYSDEVRRGDWANCPNFCFIDTPIIELAGNTLGIVGFGQIGRAVADIALSMGMKVAAYTSKSQSQLPEGVTKTELDELFKTSDIVSLHCPLTPDTRNLVNAERLALMKPTAIIINTSRGPVVDEQDLADALNDNKIFAAGVDVLSQEPPKADNPLLSARNCYITPHIAWASIAARRRLISILVNNIQQYMSGNTINNVAK